MRGRCLALADSLDRSSGPADTALSAQVRAFAAMPELATRRHELRAELAASSALRRERQDDGERDRDGARSEPDRAR